MSTTRFIYRVLNTDKADTNNSAAADFKNPYLELAFSLETFFFFSCFTASERQMFGKGC